MKAFKRKLRSRTGASITFALLLFLVCTVVSSIVIVAGTAAGGRLSQMAKMDQRYYAVTSAAELLLNVFDKSEVKITYEVDKCEAPGTIQSAPVEKKVLLVHGEEPKGFEESFLVDASTQIVLSLEDNYEPPTSVPENVDAMYYRRLTLKEVGTEDSGLNCVIDEKVTSDRMLVFEISNDAPAGEAIYRLRLTFSSDIKETALDVDSKYMVKTVSWKLHSLRKIRTVSTSNVADGIVVGGGET